MGLYYSRNIDFLKVKQYHKPIRLNSGEKKSEIELIRLNKFLSEAASVQDGRQTG